eukprot:1158529-Pelagomonas_calceolata.AAC.7
MHNSSGSTASGTSNSPGHHAPSCSAHRSISKIKKHSDILVCVDIAQRKRHCRFKNKGAGCECTLLQQLLQALHNHAKHHTASCKCPEAQHQDLEL